MNSPELENYFRELISIPSVTGTAQERQALDWVHRHTRKLEGKYAYSEIRVRRVGKSLNGVYQGAVIVDVDIPATSGKVALSGHVDVVPVNDEKWKGAGKNPFQVKEVGSKLYARGACDMKSGNAIMMDMIRMATTNKPLRSFRCIFSTGEEEGYPNGLTVAAQKEALDGVDFLIALEPTDGHINLGVFGFFYGEYIFDGQACHTSHPQDGVNAVYTSIDLISAVRSGVIELGSFQFEDTSYDEVICITSIQGGGPTNVVPDQAIVGVNYRPTPNHGINDVQSKMEALVDRFGATSLKIQENDPAIFTRSDHPEIRGLQSAVRAKFGLNVAQFWSDIGQASLYGVPAANYGPGSIKQAHRNPGANDEGEYIEKLAFESVHHDYIRYLFGNEALS